MDDVVGENHHHNGVLRATAVAYCSRAIRSQWYSRILAWSLRPITTPYFIFCPLYSTLYSIALCNLFSILQYSIQGPSSGPVEPRRMQQSIGAPPQ